MQYAQLSSGTVCVQTIRVNDQTKRRILGRFGEWLASVWIRFHGYGIYCHNWRCKAGELDIVAFKTATLLFIEVKTRWRRTHRRPAEAVVPAQRKRIIRAARLFLHRHPEMALNRTVDFTIVDLVMTPWPQITVIRDAFRGN